MRRLLPLFPLQLVAFPGAAIPLHIFEPRYRDMVGEAEVNGTEFGVILARNGGIVRTGCAVAVETILQRYPDGRFDVLTRGRRRFEIRSIDEEKEYLRAEVEYFDDNDSAPADPLLRAGAMRAWRELQRQAGPEFPSTEPDVDDPILSFRIAPAIQDLEVQNALLMSRSEADRLGRIVELTPRLIERTGYIDKMRRTAPSNGRGHTPASAE